MPHNVLYLHHVAQMSGAEHSLQLLVRALDRTRVVPVFAGPASGPFPRALADEGIPLVPVAFGPLRDVPGLVRNVIALRRVVRERKIALLHANGPQTNVCAGLVGRLERIPVIWHARNLLYRGMRDVDRLTARLATRIICNSNAVRERFRGSRAWDKSVTILNAVDLQRFNPAVPREPFRREQGLAPAEVAVGLVGRIGYQKGGEEFVTTAIRLLRAGSPATFFVVGDAVFPEDEWRLDRLREQVKEAALEGRIRFLGRRSDVPSVMRGLDILVQASELEACSRALCEGLASGTAIVATASGGNPELVRDGIDGVLVPPGDPEALARGIDRLIRDPALRERLGNAAAARAREHLTVDSYVAAVMAVYESAWGAQRGV